MIDRVHNFRAAVAAIIAAMTALWGWFGWLVVAWIAAMTIDYLTGYFAAMRNGEWSSQIAREGIWHKVGCIVTVTVACILDAIVGQILGNIPAIALPWNYTVLLAPLVVAWYILMEFGSILENVGRMGAKIPGFLQKAIAALNGVIDDAGEDAMK